MAWTGFVILVVCGAMVAWEMHEKAAHAPAPAQPLKPSPATQATATPPAIGAMVAGNGTGITKLGPAAAEDHSYLFISLSSKGEMLLQDPQGRFLGFDAGNHRLIQEAANGHYDEGDMIDDDDDEAPTSPPPSPTPTPTPTTLSGLEDNGFRRIELGQPAPGKYVLTVVARNETNYSLVLNFRGRDDNLSTAVFEKVSVSPGDVHVYEFEIPAVAAGELKPERRNAAAPR
ncbi:MAG TPA: hypothetical protein VF532_12645 [Candidatus Angelobacter sp.]